MSAADNGGNDLVIEVGQNLISTLVAGQLANLPDATQPIAFGGIDGTLTVRASVESVAILPGHQLRLVLGLHGTTIAIDTVPSFLQPLPENLRNIEVIGDVAVALELTVTRLLLEGSVETTVPLALSEAVFDSVLSAPLVQFLLAETLLQDPTGGLYQQMRTVIITALTEEVQAAVTGIANMQLIDLTDTSRELNAAIGKPIRVFACESGVESLFLLLTIGGTPGQTPSRSDLLRTTSGAVPADGADLIISNACLMRDFIRHELEATLKLTPGGFLPPAGPSPGAPLAWGGAVAFPGSFGPAISSASITSVIAGVDGTNLRLLVGAKAVGILDSFTVTAEIDITVRFTATITAGTLTLALTPVAPPAVRSQVTIEWWVYVAGYLIAGLAADIIIAAANAFADEVANSLIAGGVALPSTVVPIPLPTGLPALSIRQTSLFQSDAPPSLVGLWIFTFPLPFPQNDIIINLI